MQPPKSFMFIYSPHKMLVCSYYFVRDEFLNLFVSFTFFFVNNRCCFLRNVFRIAPKWASNSHLQLHEPALLSFFAPNLSSLLMRAKEDFNFVTFPGHKWPFHLRLWFIADYRQLSPLGTETDMGLHDICTQIPYNCCPTQILLLKTFPAAKVTPPAEYI